MSDNKSDSHQTTVNHEVELNYEKQSLLKIPVVIYELFREKVPIIEPNSGFTRIFGISFASCWSGLPNPDLNKRKDVEINFMAHTKVIDNTLLSKSISSYRLINNKNVNVKKTGNIIGKNWDGIIENQEQIKLSLEKDNNLQVIDTTYILAEITYGGTRCLEGKVEQLEIDCRIAMQKLQTNDVFTAVSLIIIVNPKDKFDMIVNYINTNSMTYNNVAKLCSAGKFMFIQNEDDTLTTLFSQLRDVPVNVMEVIGKFDDLEEKTEEFNKEVIGKFDELKEFNKEFNKQIIKNFDDLEKKQSQDTQRMAIASFVIFAAFIIYYR